MEEPNVFVFSKERAGTPTDKCLARFSVGQPSISNLALALDENLPAWRQQIQDMAILIHDRPVCAKVLRLLGSKIIKEDRYQWDVQGLVDGCIHVYQFKPSGDPDMYLGRLPLRGGVYMAQLQLTNLCAELELATSDLVFLTELKALHSTLELFAKMSAVKRAVLA